MFSFMWGIFSFVLCFAIISYDLYGVYIYVQFRKISYEKLDLLNQRNENHRPGLKESVRDHHRPSADFSRILLSTRLKYPKEQENI